MQVAMKVPRWHHNSATIFRLVGSGAWGWWRHDSSEFYEHLCSLSWYSNLLQQAGVPNLIRLTLRKSHLKQWNQKLRSYAVNGLSPSQGLDGAFRGETRNRPFKDRSAGCREVPYFYGGVGSRQSQQFPKENQLLIELLPREKSKREKSYPRKSNPT